MKQTACVEGAAMSRILTAFAREESREAVNTMLERCGMPP